jgi:MFS family permease
VTAVPDRSGPGLDTPADGGFPWRMAATSVLTITVVMLTGFLPGALAVQMAEDLDISVSALGFVVGLFFAVSALGSAALGRLTEHWDWPRGMRLAAIGAAVTLGLTPLLATSALTLGALAAFGGLAGGLVNPAVNLALARCTVLSRRGLVYGFKHAALPATTLLGGLAVPTIALPFGWRWAYVVGSLLAVGALLLIPFRPARFEVDGPTPVSAKERRPSTMLSLLVVIAVGAALGIGGIDAFATFLVTYSVDIGFSETAAGLLLAAGSATGIATRLVSGHQMDRRDIGGLPTVSIFTFLGAVGLAVIASGVEPLVVVGTFVAYVFGWGWSGLLTYSVVRVNPLAPAAATGITMTGTFVGAAVGPPLFGVLAEGISFTVAWLVTAVALAAAGVIMRYAAARVE